MGEYFDKLAGQFGPDTGSQMNDKNEEPEEKLKKTLDFVADTVKVRALQKLETEPEPRQPPAGVDKEMAGMFTAVAQTLQALVTAERDARTKADLAKTEAEQKYFNTLANWANDLMERAKASPTSAAPTKNELEIYQTWHRLISDEASKIVQASQAATLSTPQGMTDSTAIELKRLELQQTKELTQLQNAHMIAMKQLELQMKQFEFDTYKWQKGEDKKTNWWEDFIGAVSGAMQAGVSSAQREGVLSPIGQTPGGLPVFECQNSGCRQKFPIYPGSQFFSCPTCGAQYKVSDEEEKPVDIPI